MQRRRFLQTAAAASALSGSASATTVKRNPENIKKIIQNASEVRRRHGKEAWTDYIEDTPVQAGHITYQLPISLSDDKISGNNEFGALSVDPGDISVDMGMWYDYTQGEYGATMSIEYDLELDSSDQTSIGCSQYKPSYGENPYDAVALTWPTNKWRAISTSRFEATTTGSNTEPYDPYVTFADSNVNTGKAAFRVNDLGVSKDWKKPGFGFIECKDASDTVYAGTVGVILKEYGEWDSDERIVNGGYTHLYNDNSPQLSLGLSIPYGATVTVSGGPDNIKQNKVIRDKNGEEIEVMQSEADYQSR